MLLAICIYANNLYSTVPKLLLVCVSNLLGLSLTLQAPHISQGLRALTSAGLALLLGSATVEIILDAAPQHSGDQ